MLVNVSCALYVAQLIFGPSRLRPDSVAVAVAVSLHFLTHFMYSLLIKLHNLIK